MSAERTVDARGLCCPMPIIELAKAIRTLPPGGCVWLRATDPAIQADIPAWCQATGHGLLVLEAEGDGWRVLVQKAGRSAFSR